MTQQPDDRTPEEPTGSAESGRGLDEDAAWAAIVANYGERPPMGSPPSPAGPRRPRNIFDRSFIQSTTEPVGELNSAASWDDEGHFVPPAPPPLPTLDPRRKLAWIGLFGAPALMLLGVVLGWRYPDWVSALLVLSFAGGFVYLVATMQRSRGGNEPWSGDDGAVV